MAWSWSHAPEAYEDAEANLHELPAAVLAVIWAEWRAHHMTPDSDGCVEQFDERAYFDAFKLVSKRLYLGKTSAEQLAADIWPRAEQFATCDNGGFNAWMCPYGCHCVGFDRDRDKELSKCE